MKFRIRPMLSSSGTRYFALDIKRWWFPFWNFESLYHAEEDALKDIQFLKTPVKEYK